MASSFVSRKVELGCCILALLMAAALADPVINITAGDWKCASEKSNGNVRCLGFASAPNGTLELTPDQPGRELEVDLDGNYTAGMALCENPVSLVDQGSELEPHASLRVYFSVHIQQVSATPGDGMAFVIFPSSANISMGYGGYSFGVFDERGFSPSKVLAVEFDTYENEFDPNNNHIGIDTTSYVSLASRESPDDLVGEPLHVWVDYTGPASFLEIRAGRNSSRPASALLTRTINLFEVLNSWNVRVGFSASNGKFSSSYKVLDLLVESSFPPSNFSDPGPGPGRARERLSFSPETISIVVGVTVGVAGVIVGGVTFFLGCRSRRPGKGSNLKAGTVSKAFRELQISGPLPDLKRFTFAELSAATDGFSTELKLGEGGSGSVYHGFVLGREVAVKKVSEGTRQGAQQFAAEVASISLLRHRHIVQLLGWCAEGQGRRLLVYEFMRNGSLDRHLFQPNPDPDLPLLPWSLRFKVLAELAAALRYLHTGWRQQVIHRDVKSSNVMLDGNFNAQLGDFGLARISDHCKTPTTTCVAGTLGYIAPEVSTTGKYTAKTDVFAFGAVCLEVVCGRRAHDGRCPEEETLLVDWVWRKLCEGDVLAVVDQRLRGGGEEGLFDEGEARLVLMLGLLCSHPKPSERPTMQSVVEILDGTVQLPAVPPKQPQWNSLMYPYTSFSNRIVPGDLEQVSDRVGILASHLSLARFQFGRRYGSSHSSAPSVLSSFSPHK